MPPEPGLGADGQAARLTWLGRANLERCGFTDKTIALAHQRVHEGLYATEVKQFYHRGLVGAKGEVIQGPAMVAWSERRAAAELVLKLADHLPTKLEHEVTGSVVFNLLGLDGDRV